MTISNRMRGGLAGVVIVAATMMAHGYASTNSIEMEEEATLAGYGAHTVMKVQVTKIKYNLNPTNKGLVNSVVFTVEPEVWSDLNDARAFLKVNEGSTWLSCGTVANNATTITCATNDKATDFGKKADNSAGAMRLVVAD